MSNVSKKAEYMLECYIPATAAQYLKEISLFFGVQWPKNQVTLIKSLFWNAGLGISYCRASNQ